MQEKSTIFQQQTCYSLHFRGIRFHHTSVIGYQPVGFILYVGELCICCAARPCATIGLDVLGLAIYRNATLHAEINDKKALKKNGKYDIKRLSQKEK